MAAAPLPGTHAPGALTAAVLAAALVMVVAIAPPAVAKETSGKKATKKAPAAPIATDATTVSSAGFTANWTAVSGVTEYRLDVSPTSTFTSYVLGYENLAASGTSRVVSELAPDTTYHYRVRAVSSGGTSPNSNVVAVTTLPPGPPASFAFVAAPDFSQAAGTAMRAGSDSMPVTVRVTDGAGTPVAGREVVFWIFNSSGLEERRGSGMTGTAGTLELAAVAPSAAGGGYQLVVSLPGSGLAQLVHSFIVVAGPADYETTAASVGPISATQTAGTNLTPAPQITVKDAYGNAKPGVAVTARVLDAANNTVAAPTSTSNSSGVAVFSTIVAGPAVGDYTLRFEVSGITTPIPGGTFTVVPGPPAIVFVTSPADRSPAARQPTGEPMISTAGAGEPIQIRIADSFGNPYGGRSFTYFVSDANGVNSSTIGGATNGAGVATITPTAPQMAGAATLTIRSTSPPAAADLVYSFIVPLEIPNGSNVDPGAYTSGDTLRSVEQAGGGGGGIRVRYLDADGSPVAGVQIDAVLVLPGQTTPVATTTATLAGGSPVSTDGSGVAAFPELTASLNGVGSTSFQLLFRHVGQSAFVRSATFTVNP